MDYSQMLATSPLRLCAPLRLCVKSIRSSGANAVFLFVLALVLSAPAAHIPSRDQNLPTKLTVGYAVRLLDMNDDKRLDIAIVDSDRILWLENPNWNEHVIIPPGQTAKDNVCFAPYDIDRDGR